MFFTFSSDNSGCLHIIDVTMTFPKIERKLYLPFPINVANKIFYKYIPFKEVKMNNKQFENIVFLQKALITYLNIDNVESNKMLEVLKLNIQNNKKTR